VSGTWRARGALLLLAVFAAGVLAGAALRSLQAPRVVQRVRVLPVGSDAFGELSLSSEQRRHVDSVLGAAQPRMDSLTREVLPQMRALAESVDVAIRGVLTAEQLRRLDSLRAARKPVRE
jgi:hypothetical protein